MNILILGNGGREHSLAWAVSQNPRCRKIYCSPGNAGTDQIATNIYLNLDCNTDIVKECRNLSIDLVIVGPEKIFAQGLANELKKENILCFGPTKEAAKLETSKVFTKEICKIKNIPSAMDKVFDNRENAKKYLNDQVPPFVIKADGLASGKGVLVTDSLKQASEFLDMIFDGKISSNKNRVIIEEFLEGQEMSLFLAIDQCQIKIIGSAQDYKRAFDGDKGPNTGGMGAFSPSPLANDNLNEKIITTIIKPTLDYLNEQKIPFSGILYAGLIIKNGNPKLIEYNVRFGDPECQVLCTRLGAQILDILLCGAENKLSDISINLADDLALTVVVSAVGYPKTVNRDIDITNIVNQKYNDSVYVFHAGTYVDGDILRNSGGRVFNFTSRGIDLKEIRRLIYGELRKVNNKKLFYRMDIGEKFS